MKIRKFQEKDAKKAALLARKTFEKFNSSDYFEKDAVQKTLDKFDPKKNSNLLENFKKTPLFYVAEEKGRIIGMIRGTQKKITSLFVDSKHQGEGIGKKLVLKFEKDAKRQGSKIIRLSASIYALSMYEKMGYKKTTGIRNFKGLKVFPMKKIIA